jgi:MobA/MobL family
LVKEVTGNMPVWAAGSAHTYFAAAEHYERLSLGNAQRRGIAFEEWKIMLPHELSRAQNEGLMTHLLDVIAGEALPYMAAFHEPKAMDGKPQPHIHLLISARRNDEHARTAEQHFRRFNRKEPARGGAQKDPAFWHQGAVRLHRLMISDVLNLHLEQHGHAARVHPEALKARGIVREPEPRLLPSESNAYRTHKQVSTKLAEVFQSRQARATQPPREQNNARQYWEARKAFLGITRDLPHDQKLAHILLKRHGRIERVPTRYRALLTREAPVRRRERITQGARLARVLVAQLEDTRAQGTLRVRLHDLERESGMSW